MTDPHARGLQGTNQHRRVSLDAFLEAQRARVAERLEQHVEQFRRRLRAYADEVAEAELVDAHDGDDR